MNSFNKKIIYNSFLIVFFIYVAIAKLALAVDLSNVKQYTVQEFIDNWTTLSYRSFTNKNGLPQNTVNTIEFDSKGYLWIGTDSGVAVYDGVNFEHIYLSTLIKKNMNNAIHYIHNSKSDIVWIVNTEGILLYKQNNIWKELVVPYKFKNERVFYITEKEREDKTWEYFIATQRQLLHFHNGNWSVLYTTKHTSSEKNNDVIDEIYTSYHNEKTHLFIRFRSSRIMHYTNNTFEDIVIPKDKNEYTRDINSIYIGTRKNDDNKLIASTSSNVYIYDIDTKNWSSLFTNNSQGVLSINKIWKTYGANKNDYIWLENNKENELIKYSPNTKKARRYKIGKDLPNSRFTEIEERNNEDITEDVWLATERAGLLQLRNNMWNELTINKDFPNLNPSSFLETTDESGNIVLWIGTLGDGLLKLANNKITTFNDNSTICNRYILDLVESYDEKTKEKILWVSTSMGLAKVVNDSSTCHFYKHPNKLNLNANWYQSLLETTDLSGHKTLWLGTFLKLLKIQDNIADIKEVSTFSEKAILKIVEEKMDSNSILWIGSKYSGLHKFDQNNITKTYSESSGLPKEAIFSLFIYHNSHGRKELLVGIKDNGLAVALLDDLNNNKPNWKILNQNSFPELPDNTIYSIITDEKNRIYLFTNKGAIRLDSSPYETPVDKLKHYTFGLNDGLPNHEFNRNAAYYSRHGHIWAGTANGAVFYSTKDEYRSEKVAPFHLKSSLIENGVQKALAKTTLSYKENNLKFDFRLLSFFKEMEIKYSYQLQGLDDKASNWSTKPEKEFTTLPDGSYIFNVWAKDHENNIIGPIKTSFTITPPIWKTKTAILSYIMLSIFSIWGFLKWRLNKNQIQQKRREKELEEKIKERTEDLYRSNEKLHDAITSLDQKNADLDRKNSELGQKNEELVRSHAELLESNKRSNRIFLALAEALPGTILDNKYQLEESIGSGGFSTVFKGFDLRLKRHVAIKVFKPSNNNATQENLERFILEGVSSCKVNHKNAVVVLDTGISNDTIPYLVMELLEGKTLTEEMRRSNIIEPTRCWKIMKPVCEVLVMSHKLGIIHRDIKPDNIFIHNVNKNEMVKVLDFGIAKIIESDNDSFTDIPATLTGNIFGTPTYMSPERLFGKHYDGKVDVYSIGIIIYKMLTGQYPFQMNANDPVSIAMAHVSSAPIPLNFVSDCFSDSLSNAIECSIEKDPINRPTIEEIIDLFDNAFSNYPIDQNKYKLWSESILKKHITQQMNTL